MRPAKIRSFDFWTIIWLVVGSALCSRPALAAVEPWSYRGFEVRESNQRLDEGLKQALAGQIDIVLSVGCDDELLRFFRSVPLLIVSAKNLSSGNPGLYRGEDRAVKITTRISAVGHKPVLLHELLHAYHHQKLPGGFSNRAVGKLYDSAKANSLFNAKSHMMLNSAEYFACAGTTFLFGVTAQEPFQRANLAKQPELMKFLQEAFGPSCGQYEGKLEAEK